MLWTLKGSFEDRVQTAARAGMQSIELVGEYAPWTPSDYAGKKQFVSSFGLGIDTLIATPDWTKRPVSMVEPEQRIRHCTRQGNKGVEVDRVELL